MPKIIPHKAFVYSSKYRSNLGALVSPPYDVISPDGFKKLKAQNEFNSIRLCLTESPEDPDRYIKMKNLLSDWKQKEIFETLKQPAFYLIEEKYKTESGEKIRVGFVGLLEVSPFSKKEVLPHEFTLSGPKVDRLELLKTMRAELSQIFFCYRDSRFTLESIHREKFKTSPFREGTDPQGVTRRVWLIDSKDQIAALQKTLTQSPVLIADGHHRYETAIHFHEIDGTDASKYVQGYFTNLDTPGFSILPIHRVFSLPAEISSDDFLAKIRKFYKVEDFSGELDLKKMIAKPDEVRLALCLGEAKKIFWISHRKESPDDAEIFSIQKNIFEKILGWDLAQLAKGVIRYEHETSDFIKALNEIKNGVGLFLPSTNLDLVMRLAERGTRMPQKSTFFFPKLASGLINYELGSY